MQLDQFDIKVEPGNDKFSKELTLRCSLGVWTVQLACTVYIKTAYVYIYIVHVSGSI